MFYKVVVTVWDIKATERRGRGPLFFFFNTFNTGGGGRSGGVRVMKHNLLKSIRTLAVSLAQHF